MRKLKNWSVVAEGVKNGSEGLVKYYTYLLSLTDHLEQSITEITHDNRSRVLSMANIADRYKNAQKLRGRKSGRNVSAGWSVVFSYPFDLTDEQMSNITTHSANSLIDYVIEQEKLIMTEKEREMLTNQIMVVCHRGEKTHTHAHIVIPKVFKCENILTTVDMTKKKYLYKIKLLNNANTAIFAQKEVDNHRIESAEVHNKRKSKLRHNYEKALREATERGNNFVTDRVLQATETTLQRLETDLVSPMLTELRKIVVGLKKSGAPELNIQAIEKLISTYEKQMANGNTDRAEKTATKAFKAVSELKNDK